MSLSVDISPPIAAAAAREAATARPRLGFLGVGWIGRQRLAAIAEAGLAEVAAIADPDPGMREAAARSAPGAWLARSLDELLAQPLDGIVIATPSALHAGQAEAALARGLAVFCQKPLARTRAETRRVIDAARAADRLLGVDLSYRETAGMRAIRELVASGQLGEVYAVDLVFHNAYGPDKPWFRDPRLAGGGCAIDLGTHLVDLALWTLGFPPVTAVTSRLHAAGRRLALPTSQVEDHATAQLDLADGGVVRLACSWNLPAGCDAVIEASFHGTRGGACWRNVNGSFLDFVADRLDGTTRQRLADPPDDWGGRAAVRWARQLARSPAFDPAIERLGAVAAVMDAIYGR